LGELGEERFVTFMCDGVAKRLLNNDFHTRMTWWLGDLGVERFVTFMGNGVAMRLLSRQFNTFLNVCRRKLHIKKFVSLIGNGQMVARFRVLGDFVSFYATHDWTQEMSRALCKRVSVTEAVPIPLSDIQQVHNSFSIT
jgi:hypothetical protein